MISSLDELIGRAGYFVMPIVYTHCSKSSAECRYGFLLVAGKLTLQIEVFIQNKTYQLLQYY